jgi:hypothetical protein
MSVAAVRSIGSPLALRSGEDIEDFEQEIVDQYALAMAAAGLSDGHVGNTRSVIMEFTVHWTARCGRRHVMTRTGSWLSSVGRGEVCPLGRVRRGRCRCSSSS